MQTTTGIDAIIWVTGDTQKYIAEVIQEDPLHLKVEEEGPYARLKPGDYVILRRETEIWQARDEGGQQMLYDAKAAESPFLTGLEKYNISDGKLHEILPSTEFTERLTRAKNIQFPPSLEQNKKRKKGI
jgi:hypothetical protein